jgi:hypothetical protein
MCIHIYSYSHKDGRLRRRHLHSVCLWFTQSGLLGLVRLLCEACVGWEWGETSAPGYQVGSEKVVKKSLVVVVIINTHILHTYPYLAHLSLTISCIYSLVSLSVRQWFLCLSVCVFEKSPNIPPPP